MVLWEIRCYPDALARERLRLLALTELQDRHGRIAWRWKAPRRDRVLYRLGELATATVPEPLGALAAGDSPGPPAVSSGPEPPSKRTTSSTRRRNHDATCSAHVEELMPLGWRIAAELEAAGRPLTRQNLVAALREAGQPTSNARAGALLARLRSDAPAEDVALPATGSDGGDR